MNSAKNSFIFSHNDEEDPSAPLVGAESFRSNFIDVEGMCSLCFGVPVFQ